MTEYYPERQKFQHRLQGIVNGLGDEISENLNGALETVSGRIIALETKADQTRNYAVKRKYLTQQKEQIEKALSKTYSTIGDAIKDTAIEVAQATPAMTSAMLERGLGITINLGVPNITKKQAEAYLASFRIEGNIFSDWLSKIEANAAQRIIKETHQAKLLGESLRQTGKRLQTALDIGRKSAEGLAHNALHTMANFGERVYWEANSKRIKAMLYQAELDAKTSEFCVATDGKRFPLDEFPWPPNHWRCRSTGLPIFFYDELNARTYTRPARLETDKTEGLRVQHVPAGTNYSEWMQGLVESKDSRDRAFALECLGPTRFQLVQDHKLTVNRLFYNGHLRSVAELKELTK